MSQQQWMITSVIAVNVLLVAIVTRFHTTLHFQWALASTKKSKDVAIIPYWLPWVGHIVYLLADFNSFLFKAQKMASSSVFAISIAGKSINIAVAPSITRQILNERHALSTIEGTYDIATKFLGDRREFRSLNIETITVMHDKLNMLLQHQFLARAVAQTKHGLEEHIANLIWVSTDRQDWETSIRLLDLPRPGDQVYVPNFWLLIRDFVGQLSSEALMGRDFMINNPNILNDLWEWDSRFRLWVLGIPGWMPKMRSASKARDRVHDSMREFKEALSKSLTGGDPGCKWPHLATVSNVVVAWASEMDAAGVPPRSCAAMYSGLLWGMNVNSAPTIFWMLWHVYSRPSLLAELRDEVDLVIQRRDPRCSSQLEASTPLAVDVDGLVTRCPLLRSIFYETIRLNVPGISYKGVTKSFSVTESSEDAATNGRQDAHTYNLRKGHDVCMPFGLHQKDSRYWPNPDAFDPRRFLVEQKDGSVECAGMKTLMPFGGGYAMCKGRKFADKEVFLFAAAIFAFWNIAPQGGLWEYPEESSGSGASRPVRDVAVLMSLRTS